MIEEILQLSGIEDPESYIQDFLLNRHLKSDTLQQTFNLSCEQMDLYYRDAYTFYEKEQFKEAADAFHALVLLDPLIKKHWMGLGASYQVQGHYEKAVRAYAMVTLLDSKDPTPHTYASQCLFKLDQFEDAQKAAAMGEELSKNIL
ncbi:MAG: hypothetical protein S4CHLAM45_08870 [Chlamydiales bacterium]|nr:hypothetical protein [Chlamydiales bacterium]MCH9620363.1 hypothetical protein [Chlamydiales bacterium]MCH9622991.1 hypothetical protein [Chlamydiales bacterium]